VEKGKRADVYLEVRKRRGHFRRGCMFSEKNIYSKIKKQDKNNRILKFSTRNLCKFGKILIFHVQEKKMI
jgi:hypothetical protein